MAPNTFLEAMQARRTIYAIDKSVPISDKQIAEIAEQVALHSPSCFNCQSSRIVLLLNEDHDTFWDFVIDVLKPILPPDQFAGFAQKIASFKAGYGTALFFEDPEPIEELRKAYPIIASHMSDWSQHNSAIQQFALWTALETEGLGASLQHYNPLVDLKAQEKWNIPATWSLRAQLVFGGKAGEASEKQFKPIEERLFVHGARN